LLTFEVGRHPKPRRCPSRRHPCSRRRPEWLGRPLHPDLSSLDANRTGPRRDRNGRTPAPLLPGNPCTRPAQARGGPPHIRPIHRPRRTTSNPSPGCPVGAPRLSRNRRRAP
jgi:hypothetical protein